MNWREWEGRTIDGKFVLGNYLGGGSDDVAVFRTMVGNGPAGGASADAAIKLVELGGPQAENQLRAWKAGSQLSHPNLLRVLALGHAADEVVYVVEEFAEENLGQIIPERALAAEEVRGMLGPLLGALAYVHGKGMAHGRIKPSNIMAAGDQVKLSSDSLVREREIPRGVSPYDAPEMGSTGVSAAGDLWSLGMTLVEVLTQHAPAWDAARMTSPEIATSVPEPFRGMAHCCLQVDPARRCGIREVEERLAGKRVVADAVAAPLTPRVRANAPIEVVAAASKSAKWPYWILLAALVAGSIFLIALMRSSSKPVLQEVPIQSQAPGESRPPQADTAKPTLETAAPAGSASSQEVSKPGPVSAPGDAGPVGGTRTESDGIVERVMPKISPSAQRTITGKIKVRVRVKVDGSGTVEQANLKDAGPSKYFAREAVDAARRWKFAPAADDAAREWTLLFVFSRARTEVTPSRAR